MKKINSEFGEPCNFCNTGRISTKFVKYGSGACMKCINSCPSNIHIEDRYNFLMADAKFKKEIL
jgi:hypothetical protein